MAEFSCQNCSSDVVIATYYNTQMDSTPIVDLMTAEWCENHTRVLERVDCSRCDTIISLWGE